MKRPVAFFLFGVFLVLFQASFLPHLFPLAPRPNLALIILVYLAAGVDALWALLWAAFTGLVFDVLSGGPFGLFSFQFLALYIIIKGASKVLVLRHPAFRAGTVFLAHLLQAFLFATILAFLGLPFPAEIFQVGQLLFCSFLVAFTGLPLFILLERIDRPPLLAGLD
jgi:rod shape-determining protein MreD